MMIVDAQVHLWKAASADWPWVPGMKPQMPEPFTIEKLTPMMDEAGVDRVVVVPPSWPGDRNDYGLEAARRYPSRFGVMGRITSRWDVLWNVGYLDSEQRSQNSATNGRRLVLTPEFSGKAEANATVTLFDGATALASVKVSGNTWNDTVGPASTSTTSLARAPAATPTTSSSSSITRPHTPLPVRRPTPRAFSMSRQSRGLRHRAKGQCDRRSRPLGNRDCAADLIDKLANQAPAK